MSDEIVWFWTILVFWLGWLDSNRVIRETRSVVRPAAKTSSSLFGFMFGDRHE